MIAHLIAYHMNTIHGGKAKKAVEVINLESRAMEIQGPVSFI